MAYQLNSVSMHITNECSHACPMCYSSKEGQVKCEGNLVTLKKIADELKNAGVIEITLVGGDPAEYSQIEELVKYLHKLGFRVPILSNTHNYKNSSIEKITPFVTSLEGTIHGLNAQIHDEFCQKENAYFNLVKNLKLYNSLKKTNQKLGIAMNVMQHNYDTLFEIVENLLEQGLAIDYILIQRIGAYGRALGTDKYAMLREEIIKGFQGIDRINTELRIETTMVDAYPHCIIPEEYHKYLSKCDWGYGTAAIDMNGNLSRCALSTNYSLGNILLTSVKEIWDNSPVLKEFRSKKYLRNECQNCATLEKCGGGCALSCGDDILSTDALVKIMR